MSIHEEVSHWIKLEAEKRGLNSLIINASNKYSNKIAIATCIVLCKNTLLKTRVISNKDDIIKNICVSLSVEYNLFDNKFIEQNLYEASPSNLIVGTRTRAESSLVRYYDKFEPVDILPLANIKLSQVRLIFEKHYNSNSFKEELLKEKVNILGFTEEELDWLEELNKHSKIIELDNDPAKEHSWFQYSIPQKKLISKAHQIEKISRHKYNSNVPTFILKQQEC